MSAGGGRTATAVATEARADPVMGGYGGELASPDPGPPDELDSTEEVTQSF